MSSREMVETKSSAAANELVTSVDALVKAFEGMCLVNAPKTPLPNAVPISYESRLDRVPILRDFTD
jgi:hypothetical protein